MRKYFILFLIFLLAFYLRARYPASGNVVFSFDQARDAYTVNQLLHGDLKIQGPPTSTRDFFHGVLYYYVIAPGYWLGHGSPLAAAYWLAFVASLGVFLVYFITRSPWLALFYAVSYEQTQYAAYLSNTSLAVLTVPLFYLGLWQWLDKKKWGPAIAGLGLGFSIQANIFMAYHLPEVIILGLFKKISFTKSTLFKFLVSLLLATSSMIISEIKFGFPSRNGLIHLLSRSGYSVSLSRQINTIVEVFGRLFSLNLLPQLPRLGVVIGILLLAAFLLHQPRPRWWPIVILGLVSWIPALVFGGISSPYLTAGLFILVLLLLHRASFLLLAGFVIANLLHNTSGPSLFAIQKDMVIGQELTAVDYIYREAEDQPFSLNTATVPLFINTTWSYLFNWYGQSKYGYLPFWHGRSQAGSLGDNLARPPAGTKKFFMLIEPTQGLPEDIINNYLDEEKKYSTFNHFAQFGDITVQNRTGK